MQLMYVTARFPPHLGGTEIHVAEVSQAMVARGHDVAVVTTDRTDNLPASQSSKSLEILRVKAYPESRDYYFAPALRRYLRNEQPDLVHVQSYHTTVAPLALHSLSKRKVPFVLSFHSGGSSHSMRRLIRPVQYHLLRTYASKASALLAVSDFERDLFTQILGVDRNKIQVVRNGVSDAILSQRGLVEREPNLIISAGRLERYKGHHRVIEAMPAVLESVPDARLLIVGSGPYAHHLEQTADALGVAKAVEFTSVSQLDRAAMGRLLGRAAVAMNLSDYEAEGIGAIEAKAMGCRVVVTTNTALRELVDGNQVSSVPDDPSCATVAASIIQALQLGVEKSTEPVRTWDHVTDDLESLYQQILKR